MKKKYVEILKESLVDFANVKKHASTVDDIINFKGSGELPTHKKANNVVSVLEDMYYREDNDLPLVTEGEETEIAQGEGAAAKINPDANEVKLSDTIDAGKGTNVSPQDTKEFSDNIVDAKADDKTVATESSDLAEDLGESIEEMFEESDEDMDSEPTSENLENEPEHEAMGDAGNDRDEKIGEEGAALVNDAEVGDSELMEGEEVAGEEVPEGEEVVSSDDLDSLPDEGEECAKCEEDETHEEPDGDEEGSEIEGEDEPDGDEVAEGEPLVNDNDLEEEEPTEDEDEDLAALPGEDEEIAEGEEIPEGEEIAGEEVPEGEEIAGEEVPEGEEEAPILDVDSQSDDSIVARESAENSIVKRLIREMKLEESVSDEDIEIEDSEEE